MTKFKFEVKEKNGGVEITIVRVSDGESKVFWNAFGEVEKFKWLMNSVTDDQAENYFPKEHKRKEKK